MRRSIRFDITVVAVATVAAVLVVAAAGLVVTQRRALTDGIDTALAVRAADLATALTGAGLDLQSDPGGESFAQVISNDGTVVTATSNLDDVGSLAPQLGTTSGVLTTDGLSVDDDRFRVFIQAGPSGVIYVGSSFDVVDEATSVLVATLAIAVPVLVMLLGGMVWWLVGRTLSPVEQIRNRVAEITGSDLHRRVPAPGTGDEIDDLAGTMNEMLRRLETSAIRQRRFVDDASHELRTPLARLQSTLDVDGRQGPLSSDAVWSVRQDVDEMRRLVDDLLLLARFDADRPPSLPSTFNLDEAVLDEAASAAQRGTITMELAAVSAVEFMGNENQIRRLVRNLLDNASRHARARVSVGLIEDQGFARLTVADDGPGVPADQAHQIFERFGRADVARSADDGGTGLGLAIALGIAQAHGGSITLENPGERGARFDVKLPIGPSMQQPPNPHSDQRAPSSK